jgi:hypothetical protein
LNFNSASIVVEHPLKLAILLHTIQIIAQAERAKANDLNKELLNPNPRLKT